MNLSLIFLTISSFNSSPFLIRPSFNTRNRLEIKNLQARSFFRSFVLTSSNNIQSSFLKSQFTHFLNPPIDHEDLSFTNQFQNSKLNVKDDYYSNQTIHTLQNLTEPILLVEFCLFDNCHSNQHAAAIIFTNKQGQVYIRESSFISCSSSFQSGALYVIGYADPTDPSGRTDHYSLMCEITYCCFNNCSGNRDGFVSKILSETIILNNNYALDCKPLPDNYFASASLFIRGFQVSCDYLNLTKIKGYYSSGIYLSSPINASLRFQTNVEHSTSCLTCSIYPSYGLRYVKLEKINYVNNTIYWAYGGFGGLYYQESCIGDIYDCYISQINLSSSQVIFRSYFKGRINVYNSLIEYSSIPTDGSCSFSNVTTASKVETYKIIVNRDIKSCRFLVGITPPFTASSDFTSSHQFSSSSLFSLSNYFSSSNQFTNSNNFSPSSSFTQSNQFSISHFFTESKSFSKSLIFSGSSDFTLSDAFDPTNCFSKSNSFTNSNDFSNSHFFTNSIFFTISHPFSPSMLFSNSQLFTNSIAFSNSRIFSESSIFSGSDFFTKSIHFSSSSCFSNSNSFTASDFFTNSQFFTNSNDFSNSHFFSKSNPFIGTQIFSNSLQFSLSSLFSQSNLFSISNEFTDSQRFSKSDEFSMSKHFTNSDTFSQSLSFSQSSLFSQSHLFSISNEFTDSKRFSLSNKFTNSNQFSHSVHFTNSVIFSISNEFTVSDFFTYSSEFTASEKHTRIFTKSELFTESSHFSISDLFTKSKRFTSSDPFTPDRNQPNSIPEPEGKKQSKTVVIISIVAAFLVLMIISIILILLFKRRKKETTEDDLLSDEHYGFIDKRQQSKGTTAPIMLAPRLTQKDLSYSLYDEEESYYEYEYEYESN